MTTAKKVLLAVMVLAILGFVLVIVLQNITDTSVASATGSGSTSNETLSTMTDSVGQDLSVVGLEDVVCTVSAVANSSNGIVIPATNFTQTNCNLAFTAGPFNGSDWEVTYTHTFNRISQINANVTGGVETFFSNANTWFALLAIVILILIVVIVMKSVQGVDKEGGGL